MQVIVWNTKAPFVNHWQQNSMAHVRRFGTTRPRWSIASNLSLSLISSSKRASGQTILPKQIGKTMTEDLKTSIFLWIILWLHFLKSPQGTESLLSLQAWTISQPWKDSPVHSNSLQNTTTSGLLSYCWTHGLTWSKILWTHSMKTTEVMTSSCGCASCKNVQDHLTKPLSQQKRSNAPKQTQVRQFQK